MKELGIFCGTFNPIHWGHLLVAERARDQYQLDKVLFITSGVPPHRHADLLDGQCRHEMVQTAVADNPLFEASRLELDRAGPSYTVDTLRELKQLYGEGVRGNLIVGADNVDSLSQWHEAEQIFRLARLLVAPRQLPPQAKAGKIDLPDGAEYIDFPAVSVSSSEIRERLRRGQSVLYMVPPAVNAILLARGHYRETSQAKT